MLLHDMFIERYITSMKASVIETSLCFFLWVLKEHEIKSDICTYHKSVDLQLGLTAYDRPACLLGLVLKHGTEVAGGVNGRHTLFVIFVPFIAVVLVVVLNLWLPPLEFGSQRSCFSGTLWGFSLYSSKEAAAAAAAATTCACTNICVKQQVHYQRY